jgi:membrane complex biogenesis BtpA family protein
MNLMHALLATLFKQPKPVIGCIHLKALPGAPHYAGKMGPIYEQALAECAVYQEQGVDGLIIENFGDTPFFPDNVPPETIAAMTAIAREIVRQSKIPVGINVLRNDAKAALAIATVIEAQFIRVNVHMHAVVSDQGIITGKAFETLRLKKLLQSSVQIWADVKVKHATSLSEISLAQECEELIERGLVDALIVSGAGTGKSTDLKDLQTAKAASRLPIIVGSGMQPDNIADIYPLADGFIIGTYFKKEGISTHPLDVKRIATLMETIAQYRRSR